MFHLQVRRKKPPYEKTLFIYRHTSGLSKNTLCVVIYILTGTLIEERAYCSHLKNQPQRS